MSEFHDINDPFPLGKDIQLKQFTVKEVAKFKTSKKAWVIFKKKVYDITKFINHHPGGYEILLKELGNDITTLFSTH